MFVLYLLIGRVLREWMPLFAYVLPVNLTAALSLCACAVLIEGAKFDASLGGIFGQLADWHYFWRCFYLASVPGIVGHVSFNALLKWLHPLILALPGKSSYAYVFFMAPKTAFLVRWWCRTCHVNDFPKFAALPIEEPLIWYEAISLVPTFISGAWSWKFQVPGLSS